ncbi:MAG: HAMP domain-containing sensor histidine kinase, partial [Pseudomonadota bacterium]
MTDGQNTPELDCRTMLHEMALSVGGEIGEAFLERLATALRDVMAADLVLITTGEGDPVTRAKAVYALKGNQPADNIAYDLEGTPCKRVYLGETIVIPTDLAKLFPKEAGLEGYVGVPIRGDGRHVTGHMAVLSATPIKAPREAESILRIFAARVEADQRQGALLRERDALIDNMKQANQALRERSQALHDANNFKTELVGMIAHDMRNPLAAVLARAELLEKRLGMPRMDAERALRDVHSIIAGVDRLSDMVTGSLARCKAESEKIELKRRRFDLDALLDEAIDANKRQAARKSIRLDKTHCAAAWVSADEGLCLAALDNLISNAIKYSEADTRVRLDIRAQGDWFEISIADEGLGMTAADLTRAFQPMSSRR